MAGSLRPRTDGGGGLDQGNNALQLSMGPGEHKFLGWSEVAA